jgi:hypothetical protein
MGDAKRRKAEIDQLKNRQLVWLASLEGDERAVAEVAINALENVVIARSMTGGCYNLAFFLRDYLKREKGIDVEMVVGWVTDDSWEGGISHAWIEHLGRKTDISLWRTDHPDVQRPGAVIIQDFDYRHGATMYTYQRELPEAARAYLDMASKDADVGGAYRHKDAEHLKIKSLAEKDGGSAEYFSMAPFGMKYEAMAGAMR